MGSTPTGAVRADDYEAFRSEALIAAGMAHGHESIG